MVIIQDGLKQGFIFEPGSVEVHWTADPERHPRDPRAMRIEITGTGRMAAAFELPGDDPGAVEREHKQAEQKELTVGEEVPPPSPA